MVPSDLRCQIFGNNFFNHLISTIMNKIRYLFLISVILATSFSCCKDDDNKPSDQNENFSEYFTCKINGVEFDPKGTFNCNNLSFYYYQQETGGVPAGSMLLSGRDCVNLQTVALRLNGFIPNTGILEFGNPAFADSCFALYRHSIEGQGVFLFQNTISGNIHISVLTPRDTVTQKLGKIEGTFEFKVANENNDSIIYITDGAFRFKVPNVW